MRHRFFGLLLLALVPACASRRHEPSAALAPTFEPVTALDQSIWVIHQDRAGTYWFGSDGRGVYRYDGTALTRLTRASGLCNDSIRAIQEDAAGNLYFATCEGISKFDGRSLVTLEESADDAPGSGWRLAPDDLWFSAGQDTGAVLRYDGERLHRLKMPPTPLGEEFLAKSPRADYPNMKYSPYDVYTTYRDRHRNLWLGTSSLGACRYDGSSFAWIHEQDLGFDLGNRSFGVRAIAEDRDGKYWLTHTRYRYTVDPSGEAQQSRGGLRYARERGLPHGTERGAEDYSYVMSMLRDEAGDLWMATYGAGVWRSDGERLEHYPVEVGGVPITVFSIYRDRRGDLWLGTHEHGVFKLEATRFERVSL
jgi:ligand-binding sensor domain-containing protein